MQICAEYFDGLKAETSFSLPSERIRIDRELIWGWVRSEDNEEISSRASAITLFNEDITATTFSHLRRARQPSLT